jgi:hypothetical protein
MDILAGCAMGALVGLLIGLSNAPVVGAVVSALLALLVTFLGLGGAGPVKIDAKIERRLTGFCIFCVIALLLGVAARANQWFAPPLSSEIKAWTDARASTEQAVMFVAFERLGILPAGETASNRTATPTGVGLFRTASEADCGTLAGDFPAGRERLKAMHDLGGPWADLAAGAQGLNDSELEAFNKAALRLACGR